MIRKKLLVCGATGFIGRNIAERFAQNSEFEVTGTYFKSKPLNGIEMIHADLRDSKTVEEIVRGKDIILQMASVTTGAKDLITKPYIHVTDNAIMNSLLLRAAFERGVEHFIFPSCTTLYASSNKLIKETDYNDEKIERKYFGVANTKVYIEKMCEFFAGLGKTKHTVIRHSNIYGPYDKFDLERSHVFGATVNKVVRTLSADYTGEKPNNITVWGDGSEKRDLLYVDDLVSCIELILDKQKKPYALYNVGSGNAVSIDTLIKKMLTYSGSNAKINYDSSKPTIKIDIALDITKAKKELGWTPRISLDEGIERTIKWYKGNEIKVSKI